MAEGININADIAQEAGILTGISMGTAFGMLVLLMLIILMVAWAVRRFQGIEEQEPSLHQDPGARDKALAGVIAVTAVLATSGSAYYTDADAGHP